MVGLDDEMSTVCAEDILEGISVVRATLSKSKAEKAALESEVEALKKENRQLKCQVEAKTVAGQADLTSSLERERVRAVEEITEKTSVEIARLRGEKEKAARLAGDLEIQVQQLQQQNADMLRGKGTVERSLDEATAELLRLREAERVHCELAAKCKAKYEHQVEVVRSFQATVHNVAVEQKRLRAEVHNLVQLARRHQDAKDAAEEEVRSMASAVSAKDAEIAQLVAKADEHSVALAKAAVQERVDREALEGAREDLEKERSVGEEHQRALKATQEALAAALQQVQEAHEAARRIVEGKEEVELWRAQAEAKGNQGGGCSGCVGLVDEVQRLREEVFESHTAQRRVETELATLQRIHEATRKEAEVVAEENLKLQESVVKREEGLAEDVLKEAAEPHAEVVAVLTTQLRRLEELQERTLRENEALQRTLQLEREQVERSEKALAECRGARQQTAVKFEPMWNRDTPRQGSAKEGGTPADRKGQPQCPMGAAACVQPCEVTVSPPAVSLPSALRGAASGRQRRVTIEEARCEKCGREMTGGRCMTCSDGPSVPRKRIRGVSLQFK